MVVDFPAPLGPMKASISPRSTVNEIESTARTSFFCALNRARTDGMNPGGFCRTVKVLERFSTDNTVSMAHDDEMHRVRQEGRKHLTAHPPRAYHRPSFNVIS
jgi:hypothetical protein